MTTMRTRPHGFLTGQKADARLDIFEYYRQRAQELEQLRKPPPVNTVYARGSMEWQAEQEKSRKPAPPFLASLTQPEMD
jgi:hypothetical protein